MTSTTGGKVANDLNELLEDVVTVPKRIYFYWIVRSQEEFDWFFDLLAAATDGPMQSIVDISVFMTGEIELSRVKSFHVQMGNSSVVLIGAVFSNKTVSSTRVSMLEFSCVARLSLAKNLVDRVGETVIQSI